ncbi:ROK family protein [Cohnella ginsengisoli]|uniref:ROK family protein n=1 Tax=Cohnella ginsengisoli TaxID=425004 RepID=A0A9X4KNA6_9BACL|nr:ROK family protein [Cohnella ginsengisoli]MDG0795086.1 ROK family protein [Cohnella ginsengisoli]
MTIGTGLGSCFLESGRLVKTRADVPSDGWLYATPYKNSMADDYISRRGVLQLAPRFGFEDARLDVRDLALLADGGDAAALRLFHRFGERMAEILAQPLLRYRPESIVLGGQISKSAHLFAPAFRQKLAESGTHGVVRVGRDTLTSTLLGIYRFMTETTFLTGENVDAKH